VRWVLGPRALQTLLDNWTSLPQEIETLRNTAGALSGRLSVDILRNLEEFSIDVGLTYFLEVMRPISDDRAVAVD
jgi:hypothetical protein